MKHSEQHDNLERRLSRWQIFFIAIGGIIGVGFFRDSSTTLALAGPLGALIAVVVVGIIAVAVMEGICEMVVLWPVPNAMVKYINAFVDEDLGIAVGVMYWYLYCVNFSAIVITTGDLTEYWLPRDDNSDSNNPIYIYKALIYAFVPLTLMAINCAPVWVFGWIEFFGGIVKIALVVGTIILMFLINAGVGFGPHIGVQYFKDGVQNNPEAVGSHAEAVLAAIPLAIFAYIGIELLTTTAFEARDPQELRLPASNIGWFSMVLYALSTGSFVANVSWQDQQLPKLFNQALVVIWQPPQDIAPFAPDWPATHAVPLIALYRHAWRFMPSFLNGCLIYSAVSCANTALYVASRQLYGLTRSIEVGPKSSIFTKALASISRVHPRCHTPWTAILISVLILVWLPFIKLKSGNDQFLGDAVTSLLNIGSVSAILMWCSQCVAYIRFSHWRDRHEEALREREPRWDKLFDSKNAGHFKVFQPWLAYLGAGCTLLTVFFLNTIPMWNGKFLGFKAISTFVSPAIVLVIWLTKKLIWPHDGRRFFLNLSDWDRFESRLLDLDGLIYPVARPRRRGKDTAEKQRLMGNSGDPETGLRGSHNTFAAGAIPREQSVQTTQYDRDNLETEGQGYGMAPVSPIERSEGDLEYPHAEPRHVPSHHSLANSGHSRAYLSPPGRFPVQSMSSHELFEADTDVSLNSSAHSHSPLRSQPQQHSPPQATSGPEGYWYGYGQEYRQ